MQQVLASLLAQNVHMGRSGNPTQSCATVTGCFWLYPNRQLLPTQGRLIEINQRAEFRCL
jgi:hypothetical protein